MPTHTTSLRTRTPSSTPRRVNRTRAEREPSPQAAMERDVLCPLCLSYAALLTPTRKEGSYHFRCRSCGVSGFANSYLALRFFAAWERLARATEVVGVAAANRAQIGPVEVPTDGALVDSAVCPLCLARHATIKPDRRGAPFFQCRACRLRLFIKLPLAVQMLWAGQAQLHAPANYGELGALLTERLSPSTEADPWAWLAEPA